MRVDLEKAFHLVQLETNNAANPDWNLFGDIIKGKKENSNQMTLF